MRSPKFLPLLFIAPEDLIECQVEELRRIFKKALAGVDEREPMPEFARGFFAPRGPGLRCLVG